MNIFSRILDKQASKEESLGNPLRDDAAIQRRQNFFATLTAGKGFRIPKQKPRTDSQGLTRGQRKRALRKRVFGLA